MSQANVRSVDALKDFKNALIAYAEEARNALSGVDMDVRRTRDWLERDQLMYWQTQVKKRNEQVSQARADLFRRQISQGNSGSVSDSDQKETLRMAIQRLRQAEEKLEKVRRWGPVLQHAIAEYNSAARPLGDRLSGDLVTSLALLDRMVASLDAYMAIKAPTLREEKTSSSSQAESASASVSNAASVAMPGTQKDDRPEDGAGSSPAEGDADIGAPVEEKPNESEVVTP
ncbi:MAG: hypothetical protein WKF75_10205 [Singulisphaera sp.]